MLLQTVIVKGVMVGGDDDAVEATDVMWIYIEPGDPYAHLCEAQCQWQADLAQAADATGRDGTRPSMVLGGSGLDYLRVKLRGDSDVELAGE